VADELRHFFLPTNFARTHMTLAIDVIGWLGVAILLVAYWLVSTRRLDGGGAAFQLLNLAGAAALIVNSYYYGALPSVGVNVAWIAIAGYALVRAGLARRRPQDPAGPQHHDR
jgi:hypothetical protein